MKSRNTASVPAAPDDESRLGEALARSEQRLQCLIELSSDYYWETDENLRFTHVRHQSSDGRVSGFIGKATWELGAEPLYGTWDEYRELREAHLPFTNFLVRRPDADGRDAFLSASGRPMYDAEGRFLGYRGITRDVTRKVRDERRRTLDRNVAGILANATDLKSGITSVIRAICESEGWEAGHYWCVPAGEHGALDVCAAWSVPGAAIERLMAEVQALRGAPGVGLVGTVLQTAKPLWVTDLASDSRVAHRDLVRRTECNSAFLFPVLSQGKPIGVLDFNARRIPEPDDGLLHVIHMLGTQIGTFYERALMLEQLRTSEERFSNTVELAAIGISHVANDGRFIHVNRSLCEMLGYTREELLALNVKQLSHPEDQNVTDESRRKLLAGETDSIRMEKRYIRKDGTPIWVRINVAANRAPDGTLLYDISAVEDISERKRAEERVQYLATHDEMTGLPNRTMFGQLLGHAVQKTRRRDGKLAVLFIDLDRFKIVNDSLGHEAGDELLKQVATRFRASLRASDVLARLGGDEFVVLLEEVQEPQEAAQVARKLLSTAIQPIEIQGQECRVTASIGIATFPADAADAQSLMKSADAAMYLAKEEGKNNYQFHSRSTNALSIERLALETNLRRALERNEFKLQYQPQVAAKTGAITGAEALLRWWNPELGAVPPARFIPLAEDTGLIVAIGRWVLNTACAQNVAWQRAGLPAIRMAVNISPRQFKDQNLIRDIAAALEGSGMAPQLLELEITEGVIMHDVNQAVRQLHAIKAMGVRLAIDDFGTGYSSLAQLKRLPIDTLKVDRSFIREIPRDSEDKAITEAVIAMGKTLGVTVVAEGVETPEQHEFLSSRACNELQGFLFSKPCHPDALAELLRSKMSAQRA